MFEKILEFENALAEFTGAPYVITTDCCTHAIELCLIYDNVRYCEFSAYTYLSIPMTMHKLNIYYKLKDVTWVGEYHFYNTRIWDSARRLEPNMYRKGEFQCLSFGHGKPLGIGRGGAILLDDKNAYDTIIKMRYDGRDLSITPWIEQQEFKLGYHYKLNPEECIQGLSALKNYIKENAYTPKHVEYPDCRRIKIVK
jgi:dTDP-4-amino-4,6-dideoxygalactose transaminase